MSCLRYGQTWGLADRGGHERKQSLGLAPNAELEGWPSSCEGRPWLYVPVVG